MKLIASLAPSRAEIEAGVVAKADQKCLIAIFIMNLFLPNLVYLYVMYILMIQQ